MGPLPTRSTQDARTTAWWVHAHECRCSLQPRETASPKMAYAQNQGLAWLDRLNAASKPCQPNSKSRPRHMRGATLRSDIASASSAQRLQRRTRRRPTLQNQSAAGASVRCVRSPGAEECSDLIKSSHCCGSSGISASTHAANSASPGPWKWLSSS